MTSEAPRTRAAWFERPEARARVFWGVIVAFVVVCLAAFAPLERHPTFGFEEIPAFQGVFSVVIAIGITLGGAWLRDQVGKPEAGEPARDAEEPSPHA
jgi:protein-S-isoprenylcysteine O-methyltransferase Ste14